MVLFFEFWITVFKLLAIVIIVLPILGLLFPKFPTWKLSNFLKFLFVFSKAIFAFQTTLTLFSIIILKDAFCVKEFYVLCPTKILNLILLKVCKCMKTFTIVFIVLMYIVSRLDLKS